MIDEILSSRTFGPERFQTTLSAPGNMRQLVSERSDETITLTRSDAFYEAKEKRLAVSELPNLAREFIDIVWTAVCKHAPRTPSILRYGALVAFEAPSEWNPIHTILNVEPANTSEFDLRFVRRFPVEEALAKRDVSDFCHAIYIIQTRNAKTSALIDYQRIFSPALASDEARNSHPFDRFVDKAIAFYRSAGWEFLKTRMERLARAA